MVIYLSSPLPGVPGTELTRFMSFYSGGSQYPDPHDLCLVFKSCGYWLPNSQAFEGNAWGEPVRRPQFRASYLRASIQTSGVQHGGEVWIGSEMPGFVFPDIPPHPPVLVSWGPLGLGLKGPYSPPDCAPG